MKKPFVILALTVLTFYFIACNTAKEEKADLFPDGTPIPEWFGDTSKIDVADLGKQFVITDFGAVGDSATLNTEAIQKTIDEAASQGGGVVVIPEGEFRTGAIFFKPNTHLHVVEDGVLMGSDNISDFPIMPSRMEGQNLDYYPAVVNAYGVNGFTISGKGTIDGNGKKYWEAFWQRRKENPKCTNLEVSRPRLVFIQNSDDVQLQDVKLMNSGFWTTHLYKCNNVKILDLEITSPSKPIKAPSTDAIDIDVCSNVLVNGCYMSVNDDAIALKGGKGPWADKDTTNGPNKNIIIQNSTFGFCHAAVCFGSESIHDRNIVVRDCEVNGADRMIRLKMRPDTPQKYEYMLVENITGNAGRFLYVKPWRQFFDLQGRETVPVSVAENFTFKNIDVDCGMFTDVDITEHDEIKNFHFENINATADRGAFNKEVYDGLTLNNVVINGEKIE